MHDSGTALTIITGRIFEDPSEQNGHSNNKPWTKRSVVIGVGKYNEEKQKYFDTNYIVNAFHNPDGSNFFFDQLKTLRKGMLVQVTGEMRARAYLNKDNEARCSREFGKSKITVIGNDINVSNTKRAESISQSSESDEIPF